MKVMVRFLGLGAWFALSLVSLVRAQVIEFESGGLRYQTLTRNGITVMFAHLPTHVREYAVIQVAVSNGSSAPCVVKLQDFRYERSEAAPLQAAQARDVVRELIERGGRSDVIRLVSVYEAGLYGMTRFRSTSGYEQRRRQYLAEVNSTRLKAAAAASAIALVETKLTPGESTDGAVFFPSVGKPLGPGKLVVTAAGQRFEFESEGSPP